MADIRLFQCKLHTSNQTILEVLTRTGPVHYQTIEKCCPGFLAAADKAIKGLKTLGHIANELYQFDRYVVAARREFAETKIPVARQSRQVFINKDVKWPVS